jgi:hypothetical protein
MQINKSTLITLTVTAISIAILFIGIVDNPQNPAVRNNFEKLPYTIVPVNASELVPMTNVQLQSPQQLLDKATQLNITIIYEGGTPPTTVYSYGIIDPTTNTVYYYNSLSWFGRNINPIYALTVALIVIVVTAALCIKYSQ